VYPIRCTSGAGVPTRGTSHWGHPLRVERGGVRCSDSKAHDYLGGDAGGGACEQDSWGYNAARARCSETVSQ
jgi:hypothetical protein